MGRRAYIELARKVQMQNVIPTFGCNFLIANNLSFTIAKVTKHENPEIPKNCEIWIWRSLELMKMKKLISYRFYTNNLRVEIHYQFCEQ